MVTLDQFNVSKTRETFGKRLGEIIAETLGDQRIQKLFEDAGGHPAEFAEKPTGAIAFQLLDDGVLTQETKNALLIAQAAERMLTLAEKTEYIASTNNKIDETESDIVKYDDEVFKYVGSERDPKPLQQAQAAWQLSQIMYNNQVAAHNDNITAPNAAINATPVDQGNIDGFKQTAQSFYMQASNILAQEGHTEAAQKLSVVANSIPFQNDISTPAQTAQFLAWSNKKAIQDANIMLFDQYWSIDQKFHETLDRLAKLTQSSIPSPKVTQNLTKPHAQN